MLYRYPDSFNPDALSAVLGFASDQKEAAHGAWELAGFGLSLWDTHPPVIASSPEAVALVEEIRGVMAPRAADPSVAVPWDKLLPLVLKLLSLLFQERG